MKPRAVSEGFQILDGLKLDARLYNLLEHHADVVASGIDVQGLIQVAVSALLEADHPKLCTCLNPPANDGKRRRRPRRGP
jgi:hypothetical protein